MFEQGTFIRIGVQEITRLGATPKDMPYLAGILRDCLDGKDVRAEVAALKSRLSTIKYSFDPLA
ncbi:MAG: Glycine hydroxymethyltransferase [Candidatus Saccharibacteria bacterium]|nr:Glycine hydroxymethyltransferase [Candidatus Saccharibacteria bacterium]